MILLLDASPPSTIADPTDRIILVPLLTSYRDYFACSEMDTFRGRYAAFLSLYNIDPADAATSVGPQEVDRHICTEVQEGVPITFLQ